MYLLVFTSMVGVHLVVVVLTNTFSCVPLSREVTHNITSLFPQEQSRRVLKTYPMRVNWMSGYGLVRWVSLGLNMMRSISEGGLSFHYDYKGIITQIGCRSLCEMAFSKRTEDI